MKKTLLIASLLPALTVAAPAFGSGSLAEASSTVAPVVEGRWFADYDEAVKVAKEEGKDLLVDFTGSDWCGWCIKLHDEVFDHEAWYNEASKKFVFVALDFPRADEVKALVPNPERNEELKNELGVRGFPTIFLMTTDGVPYAQTGYQAGGPEAYLEHMDEIGTAGKEALVTSKRVADAFTSAEGDEAKWAAWDDLVAAFNKMDANSPFVGKLVEHVQWALEADADNKAGKKDVAVMALLSKGQGTEELIEYAKSADPKNEMGMYELTVDAQFNQVRDNESALAAAEALKALNQLGFKDTELGFRLNFSVARWYAGPLADNDEDGSKKAMFGKKAMELGTSDSDAMEALKEIMG